MQFALEDNIWSKHSPLSIFKEACMYPLKDSIGCSRAFQSVLWNGSTHTTTWSRNMGLIEYVGFHMPTTQRDPVSVICMMIPVLSSCHYRHKLNYLLQCHSEAPAAAQFLFGQACLCFPLLFHLQSCPWEGWVSDGEEVGSDGSDRGMFMLDFHVVPLYPMENRPSPLHSESCIKPLCVFGGKGWVVLVFQLVHHVQLGGSDVLIPFYHPHWLRSPACLWWDGAVLAQFWCRNPYAGLNHLSFCKYFSTSKVLSMLWQSTGFKSEEIPLWYLCPLSMARKIASCGTHWDPRREKWVVLTPTFPDTQTRIKTLCPQLFHVFTLWKCNFFPRENFSHGIFLQVYTFLFGFATLFICGCVLMKNLRR